jgi:hypothetical protein
MRSFEMIFRGAWSATVHYTEGQVVTRNGTAYVCVLAHTNHGPANDTYWTVVTAPTIDTDSTMAANSDSVVASQKATKTALAAKVSGVGNGYKLARGEHTQAAASDTVASGLATVVAVVVSPRTRTAKQLFFDGSPGDQAGSPAAGSFLILSKKPTAVNDVTPTAATDFTDNIVVDWIAIGT